MSRSSTTTPPTADPSIPLQVTGVTPVGASGIGPSCGYTQFTITFNPNQPAGDTLQRHRNFHRDLQLPDRAGQRRRHVDQPRRSESLINGTTLRKDDPMDQNADGTVRPEPADDGRFTGMTPGDVYAVPRPTTASPAGAASPVGTNTGGYILSPPFNQNTLPLIVPGPQVVCHAGRRHLGAALDTGSDNLLINDTTSQFNVTFDRPMQVSTLHPRPGAVDHGPGRLDHRPADLRVRRRVDQSIPAATSAGARHAQLDADHPELQRHASRSPRSPSRSTPPSPTDSASPRS